MPLALQEEEQLVRYVPLSRQQHGAQKWSRPSTFGFAAREAVVPVVGLEIAAVATTMPTAFLKDRDRFVLVALLSLEPGKNLFTLPDGRWLKDQYIPAMFRAYPFRMLRRPDSDQLVLCIDEEAGLLGDGPQGEALFDETGRPSAAIGEVVKFLEALEKGRLEVEAAVAALAKAELIIPWEIKRMHQDRQVAVNGMHRIDEQRLRTLDDNAFLSLRRSAALQIAHAQLISMSCLNSLARLSELHRMLASTGSQGGVNLSELLSNGSNDLLRF